MRLKPRISSIQKAFNSQPSLSAVHPYSLTWNNLNFISEKTPSLRNPIYIIPWKFKSVLIDFLMKLYNNSSHTLKPFKFIYIGVITSSFQVKFHGFKMILNEMKSCHNENRSLDSDNQTLTILLNCSKFNHQSNSLSITVSNGGSDHNKCTQSSDSPEPDARPNIIASARVIPAPSAMCSGIPL